MAIRDLAGRVLNKAKAFGRLSDRQKAVAIKGLVHEAVKKVKQLVRPDEVLEEDPRLLELLDQSLLWGTREQAQMLEAAPSTVAWGYHWIIRHLSRESLFDKILVDLGSGVWNSLIVYYSDRVRHAYLIDLLNVARPVDGATVLRSDLEEALPLPDASVDLVVSRSVLEHLSSEGRLLQMREIERVLRPGGKAFLTVSYLFGLNEHVLEVLSREPGLVEDGNSITSRLDVAAMLEQAPGLRLPGTCDRTMFPGFEGFDEQRVLEIPELLTNTVTDSQWATFTPETNALAVKWAEVAIALEKPPVADIEAARSRQAGAAQAGYKKGDVRLQRLLTACGSVAGKTVLVLYDNEDRLCSALEEAGAIAHSCVPDIESYAATKKASPSRRCWVHDLERPWHLSMGERYDIVFAFDVLHRLSDPKPLVSYITQLAPRIVIDTVVADTADEEVASISSDEAARLGDPALRCAPSASWIEAAFRELDVAVHDLSRAVADTPSACYSWDEKGRAPAACGGRLPRRLFMCERRRDSLSPVIVHAHLPKTGGQSVNLFLKGNYQDRMLHYYPYKTTIGQWDVFKEQVNAQPEPLGFTAHSARLTFPPILGGRLALYITFIRHPYDTLVSYCRYVKKNYDVLPIVKTYLPGNCKNMSVKEIMHWYLRTSQPGHFPGHILPVSHLTLTDDVDRAKRLVSRFLCVGITEEMERSMALLKTKLGPYGFRFRDISWEKINTTADVELEGYDVREDKEFLRIAAKSFAHELEFYEWARERFGREAQRYGI